MKRPVVFQDYSNTDGCDKGFDADMSILLGAKDPEYRNDWFHKEMVKGAKERMNKFARRLRRKGVL